MISKPKLKLKTIDTKIVGDILKYYWKRPPLIYKSSHYKDVYIHNLSKCNCLLCNKQHTGCYLTRNPKNSVINFKCHSIKDRCLRLVIPTTPNITFDEILNQDITNFHYDFHNRKILACESNMGTGKTIASFKYMEQHSELSMLIITHRRTLATKYEKDLTKLKFTNYMDVTGKLKVEEHPHLIISVDSLNRLSISSKWDFIMIDECDQILGQFNSDVMKNKQHNFNQFKSCLEDAKQLLLLDEHLYTSRVINFMTELFNRNEIWTIKNQFIVPCNRVVSFINKKQEFTNEILTSVKNGEKIVIPSTSKEYLDELLLQINAIKPFGYQVKFYTSRNSQDIANDQKEGIVNSWGKVDCIGYTPTVTSGISALFTTAYFDKLYAYVGCGSTDYQSTKQMLWRVRQLKTGEMNIHITNTQPNGYPDTIEGVEQLLTDIEFYINKKENITYAQISKKNNKPELFYPIKDISYRLHRDNIIVQNKSDNNFGELFEYELAMSRIPFKYYESHNIEDDINNLNVTNLVKTKIKFDNQKLSQTDTLTTTQYDEIKIKDNKTEQDILKCLKFECNQLYQIKTPTENQITNYYNYDTMRKYVIRSKLLEQLDKACLKQINHSINNAIEYRKDNFDYFSSKFHHIEIDYVQQLLSMIGIQQLNQQNIKQFQILGLDLYNGWIGNHQLLIDGIETMCVKHNIAYITRETCQNWTTNKQFVCHFNSIIKPLLGIELKVAKRHMNDPLKYIYQLIDVFQDDIEIKPIKTSLEEMSGKCLL